MFLEDASLNVDDRDLDRQYRAVLSDKLARLEASAERLKEDRQRIENQLAATSSEIAHIRALLGELRSEEVAEFTGRRVATPTDVVRLLEQQGRALHYREIETLLRQQGFETGGGADPANSLLARYYDDPRLYRPSRGTYDLRSRAPGKVVRSVGQRRRARRSG
jgi:hypothetical protein